MRSSILYIIPLIVLISCTENKTLKYEDNGRGIDTNDLSNIEVDSILWDIEQLFEAPNYRVIDSGKVWKIIFEGPVFDDTLREVFGYYSNPSLLKGGSLGEKEFPAIVCVHGGGGRAFAQWVEKWAAEGYAAIAFDMSARDSLSYFDLPSGPKANKDQKFFKIKEGRIEVMWQVFAVGATLKAHSLLLNLPQVDKNRTCITGISWGGYLTCIASGLDHRFKAAVPVYGCGYWDDLVGPKVNFDQLSKEQKDLINQYLDPKHYLPNVKCPIFFLNGNKDMYFDIINHANSVNLVSPELRSIRYMHKMKHSHERGWEPHEIKYFFESIFNNGFPLPKVTSILKNDTAYIAEYSSSVSFWHSEFYYTNDTTSDSRKKKWDMIIPIKAKNKLIVPFPKEEIKLGFFTLADHRNVSVSSELIIE